VFSDLPIVLNIFDFNKSLHASLSKSLTMSEFGFICLLTHLQQVEETQFESTL
jgi:hypothetical protein